MDSDDPPRGRLPNPHHLWIQPVWEQEAGQQAGVPTTPSVLHHPAEEHIVPSKTIPGAFSGSVEEVESQGQLPHCMSQRELRHLKKSIGKALTDTDGLSMKEIVEEFTGQKIGPTFFCSSKPINRVWAMADIKISNTCVMPAGYGIGDHRMFIVDLVQSRMIGETPCQIQQLVSHRLNTKVPGGGAAKYIATLELSLARHRLIECLGQAYKKSKSKKALCRRLNKIDQESKELMKNAEKTCQRIKSRKIPFSPKAILWIQRALIYIVHCSNTILT